MREDDHQAVGVDMNAGQVAVSTGDILWRPDVSRHEARRRRYQRRMARQRKGGNRRERTRGRVAKVSRRIANIRKDWAHKTSRQIADTAHTVVIEDLHVRRMTKSARGTQASPGRNVRQKAGLNREILATGWGDLRRMLEYKAARVVVVNPAYTSQTCSACRNVDARNRRAQPEFCCVACGHESNADINAALNVMASGVGASGRRGALVLATPWTRQIGAELSTGT